MIKYVYVVQKTTDMTEGKGGYVVDKIFAKKDHAIAYTNNQQGIMGIEVNLKETHYTFQKNKEWYDAGWQVVECELHESKYDHEAAVRKKAMAKLTDEEIKILGL